MPRAKHIAFLIIVGLSASTASLGDVAPDPGFKRISLKLIIETRDDFPEHRFFIRSGADLKEIQLKRGESTTIEPLGGGAYYSAGTLLAVPNKNLQGLSESPTNGKLNELQKAIYDGAVPGTIELVKHSFAREVPRAEASDWQDPVYRIEIDGQGGPKAVHVSGGANVSNLAANENSGLRFWRSAAAAIVAGIFLMFGVAMLGILYFRKTSKQS